MSTSTAAIAESPLPTNPLPRNPLPTNRLPGNPLPGNLGRHVNFADPRDSAEPVVDLPDATVITSEAGNGNHRPVLDLDCPVTAVPSSTPNHFHLYIDREMTWPQYRRLLRALTECGLLEPGYTRMSIRNRYTAVRPPWTTKQVTDRTSPASYKSGCLFALPTIAWRLLLKTVARTNNHTSATGGE